MNLSPSVGSRLLILLLLISPSLVFGQSRGSIQGTVTDATTGEPLPGANVYLQETYQGTATSLDGRYELPGVPAGAYTLVVSLIGFGAAEQAIRLEAGQTLTEDVALTATSINLGEVLAVAERSYSAASSKALRAFDLVTRPTRSAQDLLRLTPGLVVAQHAGGGKAEQIFLRGFDADHGTDVHISVDGMPVNMVSHGHGQGYADLHFVIPETIQQIDVHKGPYAAEFGNLATAGAIAMTTRNHLDNNLLRLEAGAYNTVTATALYQLPLPGTEHQGAYLAGQFYNTDGPVESAQGFQRFNLFGKFHTHLSDNARLSLSAGGFGSAWDASGQIPQRAVDQGLIGRFGSIDDLEGGTTGRQDVNLTYESTTPSGAFQLRGYASRYTFKLFSNFTFFLEDPVAGDMIEQTDNREIFGLDGRYRLTQPWGGATLGGGFRSDDIAVSLWQSPARVRETALVDADIIERNLYLWGQQEFVFSPRVRLQLGLRGDYFTYDVNDHLDGDSTAVLPHASGYAQQAMLSPKASLVVSPTAAVDLFVNAGSGFHTNDARAIVIGERIDNLARLYRRSGLSEAERNARLAARNYDPSQVGEATLPRALGGEVGLRTRFSERWTVAAAAWGLRLEREFVFVGDAGTTELSGATERYGLDLEARFSLTSWLAADADLNLSRGVFVDEPEGANEIPLAPRVTSTGGLTVAHPSGYRGSLRYVHIGDRPANEDGSVTAQGYTVFNLLASYQVRSFQLSVTAENLFDVAWNEAQFDTESLLPGEGAPVSELHFTPGTPRNIRVGVAYLF